MRCPTGFIAVTALTATLTGAGVATAADAPPKEAVAAPAAATAAPAANPAAANPAEVVTKVNGVAITRAELDRATEALLGQSHMQGPTDAAQKKKAEEAALSQMVSEELLYQAAKKETIPDLDKKVEEQVAAAKAQFPSPEDFEKALVANGITAQQLKDFMQRDVVISAYIEKEVSSKITITTEQAKKFYDENLDKFKTPESVHASHILIGVDPKATPEEKLKAKEKADGILKQVTGGGDFAELAKKESSCPSAPQGGDLGEFARGQMVKPFEDVAFSLKPGDVSGVVETQFGYHIIKSTGKKDAGVMPFDQVKDKIEQYLKEVQTKEKVMAKVEELKKAAKIETPK
ncbi:peptidylprolyl isomerase [uncultured Thiodictyon sp.]|uniref:peptidylprolyl isomerase n=1 Tax=uncultured Thiodictyon sp. TaxID=1846217 RepID=UPI0025FB28F4|nr:peptidylprolyl isomerase [uncultured Thiodictyon sp.]